MIHSTITSREFARDVGAAKRAAAAGPVFITDRGTPSYALLKIDDFHALAGAKQRTLLDVMDEIDSGDFEVDLPRIDGQPRPLDL